ncbi:MAG: hypothetical protein JNG88_12980 [Phycisphaerales bacterium]|nr:hypothetical protein [Phycisphaerales bacterium]
MQHARAYLAEVFPDAFGIRLEELGLTEDEKHWSVTLSFLRQTETADEGNVFAGALRNYKAIDVDAHTGQFIAMRIRLI